MLRSFLQKKNSSFSGSILQRVLEVKYLSVWTCLVPPLPHSSNQTHSLNCSLFFVLLCTIKEIRRSCGARTGTTREIPSLGRNAGRANLSDDEGEKGQQGAVEGMPLKIHPASQPEMLLL